MLSALYFPAPNVSYATKTLGLDVDELVIFDPGVDNLQQLIDGIKLGIDWVVLNPHQDGIEQITRILANYSEIQTLQIVSHGAPGCLFLGNTQLSLETLEGYTTQLQSWFAPLAPQIWGEQALKNQHQSPLFLKAPIFQSPHLSKPPMLGVWGQGI